MSNWNGLDFFIFLIFFLNLVLGMSRGATKEIVSMMCLSVALIFTIKFTLPLYVFLNKSPLIQDVLTSKFVLNFMAAVGAGPLTADMLKELSYSMSVAITFFGTFFTCEAGLSIVGFSELFTFPYAMMNRKVGGTLGTTRGYVISVIVILLLIHMFKTNPITGSFFMNLFQGTANTLDSLIAGQQVEQYPEIFKNKNLYNEKDIYKMLHQEQMLPQKQDQSQSKP